MKFIKLTLAKYDRKEDPDGKTIGEYVPDGQVLVNIERVNYVCRTMTGEATDITFMDNENASCSVIVMETFQVVERAIHAHTSITSV